MCRISVVSLLAMLLGSLSALASDWPQLLGPTRNGEIPGDRLPIWSEPGPREIWIRTVGAGFAGPAVRAERVVLFHREGNEEVLEAFAVDSGDTVWRATTSTQYRDDFGFDEGPRAVPLIAGDQVFTVGASGALTAWSLESGRRQWQRDTRREFSVPKGFFGVATSPLVSGRLVLLNVGGDGAGIVAFDRETGATVWQSTDDGQSYSSPILARVADQPAALFFTREGLVAVAPENGAVLTRFDHKTRIRSSVNAATPLVIGRRVFLSAEYGAGAAALDLPGVAGEAPVVVWSDQRALNNHYATSVHRSGVLYGFHGRQESGPALRAVALMDGRVLWSQERFGAGALLRSGDRLLILGESGLLTLAEARPERYRELARAQILDGVVRAYPAFAGGRLFARSSSQLIALELRPGSSGP